MSGINEMIPKQVLPVRMECELDILDIARWVIATYGVSAVPIIKRRAAENLLAGEEEAAECWRRVADAADAFLYGRRPH